MSGAERRARKRKQERAAAANAVAAARSGGARNKVIITVVALVLLAGAVIGGVIYTNNQKNATGNTAIPAQSATSASYPVRRDGPLVVVGKDDAKLKLDVYEDFLCPACGQFEARDAGTIESKISEGVVQVRYHMLPMLNEQSDPPGYSRDSANAGLCAADAGKFPAFHASLYRSQPEEGARGYDKPQLVKLGQDLGITDPGFAECVTNGRYDQILEAELDKTRTTPYLQQTFPNGRTGFGTPTVAAGEQIVEASEPGWLDQLLASR